MAATAKGTAHQQLARLDLPGCDETTAPAGDELDSDRADVVLDVHWTAGRIPSNEPTPPTPPRKWHCQVAVELTDPHACMHASEGRTHPLTC